MNCIRCGRTISDDALFCPICSGMEEIPRVVPKTQVAVPERQPKRKRNAKKAQIPAPQRRLRRALTVVCLLCVCLIAGSVTLGYFYFTKTNAREEANQMLLARQQDDYQAVSAALTNTQEQLETAKATIARQNSRLLVLENLLDGADLDALTLTLAQSNETLNLQIAESDSTITNLTNQVAELTNSLSIYKEKATFYAKNIAFVNENDTYYHAYGCPHLDLEANWYPIRLNTPEANGCRPCGECEENN